MKPVEEPCDELLNQTGTSFVEEAEYDYSGEASPISVAKVFSSKALDMDTGELEVRASARGVDNQFGSSRFLKRGTGASPPVTETS